MTTTNKLRAAVMGLGFAALFGSTALAAPVSVRDAAGGDGIFASAGLHQAVSIKVAGVFNNFTDYDAGAFGLQQSNASPLFPNASYTDLITYCFEIGQNIGNLPFTYQSQALAAALGSVVPAAADPNQAAERIRRLWAARFATSIDEGLTTLASFEGISSADTKERAAAFQIAVWELAVDNGDGLENGNFRAAKGGGNSSQRDVFDLATAYLTIAKGNTSLANLEALSDSNRQDLLRPGGGGPNGAAIPAPGTLALFGAGMVALAAFRRLKKA